MFSSLSAVVVQWCVGGASEKNSSALQFFFYEDLVISLFPFFFATLRASRATSGLRQSLLGIVLLWAEAFGRFAYHRSIRMGAGTMRRAPHARTTSHELGSTESQAERVVCFGHREAVPCLLCLCHRSSENTARRGTYHQVPAGTTRPKARGPIGPVCCIHPSTHGLFS